MDDQARTVWSYWDLWFCLVALADHAGDLDALSEAIENGGRMLGGGTVESKRSQAHPTSTKPPVTITSKSAIADDRLAGPQWHARPLLALPHAPLPHRPDAGNTLPNAPFRGMKILPAGIPGPPA